ncbi:VCBS repeat-containing protein, partial [Microbulbifer sp. 2205BS26-8]|uniref:FG-GAP repeat domain-containing protein n=1 Tax=Microbulbifer sp. 2205BS26-8 TaxID=3064386 RepID=UPI00273F0BD4
DAIFADFNGDGLADYISAYYRSGTGGEVEVRLLEPSGEAVSSNRYYKFSSQSTKYPLDVPGVNGLGLVSRVPDTLGDFNGDGAMDLLVATPAGYRVAIFDQPMGEFRSMGFLSTEKTSKNPIAIDINSDGLTDIAYTGNYGGMHVQLSTGTGFVDLGTMGGSKGTFVDLNKDGYQDFVWTESYG